MDVIVWMQHALTNAQKALNNQEVAVGCLFLISSKIIAQSYNTVNETKNPTRHAELNCIDRVLYYCKLHKLDHSKVFRLIEVVVTVEPCVMCAEALHRIGVRKVVYGCKNDRFGGTTVFDVSLIREPSYSQMDNILANEAMKLLKQFYAGSNPNVPESKTQKQI